MLRPGRGQACVCGCPSTPGWGGGSECGELAFRAVRIPHWWELSCVQLHSDFSHPCFLLFDKVTGSRLLVSRKSTVRAEISPASSPAPRLHPTAGLVSGDTTPAEEPPSRAASVSHLQNLPAGSMEMRHKFEQEE
uniref:Uncharacterized protein n=1 Tax=Calidris pygmaea TaxID=425635 RepID=A0A8C3PU59_9CHAR